MVVLGILCLLQPSSARAQGADRKELMKQARTAYSNLKDRGLSEFKANLTPNWEVMLKDQLGADPKANEATLKRLREIRFSMTYDAEGAVKVTHTEPPAGNEQQAAGYKQIFGGMAQTVSGFFATWTAFMPVPPLPEVDGEYKIEEKEDHYRLAYKEGEADVVTTLSKDFAVRELKVSTKEFESVLKPSFRKTPKGLLLVGYEATYEGPGNSTQFKAEIENQEAAGYPLPSKLSFKGTFNKGPIAMEIAFTDYEVKKR
jgi:hypothetical protein